MLKMKLVYRESVYKALMRLVKQGLVEKTYIMEKGISYSLNKSKLVIDFVRKEWQLE